MDALRAALAWPPSAWIAAAIASAVSTAWLASLARRLAWVDDGSDAPERKLQRSAVPLVGGAAILVGLAAAQATRAFAHAPGIFSGARLGPLPGLCEADALGREGWIWIALVTAFCVGLCDDLAPRGLSPWEKLAGQVVVGCVLARAASASDADWTWTAWCIACAVVALNASNTFDNADGATASLGILGLALPAPACAASIAGFLPFNLWLRARSSTARIDIASVDIASVDIASVGTASVGTASVGTASVGTASVGTASVGTASVGTARESSPPRAYLGDSGSHVVGVLLLLDPRATVVLALPLLDLARLCFVRARRGLAPWSGDRRHVAHRLMRAGLSPSGVVAVLAALNGPALWAAALHAHDAARVAPWIGFLGVGAALAVAVWCTPAPD